MINDLKIITPIWHMHLRGTFQKWFRLETHSWHQMNAMQITHYVLNSNYLQLSFPYPFLLHTPTLHNDLLILVAWSFWHILKLKSFYVQLENVFSALWAMVTKQFSTSMHFNKFPVKKSAVSSNRFYDNAQLSLRRKVICWHIFIHFF